MAQLPPVGHEQFYSILAANDEMVFMHVDEPGGEFNNTVYTVNTIIYNIIQYTIIYNITYTTRKGTVLLQYCIINKYSDSSIKFYPMMCM